MSMKHKRLPDEILCHIQWKVQLRKVLSNPESVVKSDLNQCRFEIGCHARIKSLCVFFLIAHHRMCRV